MISGRKNALGIALIVLLMGITGGVILRGQPLSLLGAALKQLRPQYILLALGFMFAYVSCEALCTKQILGRPAMRPPLAGAWATPLWAFMSARSPRRPPAASLPRFTT